MEPLKKKIIIVGGGAGGLELAARLSNKFKQSLEITLIDKQLKHVWKPLYHEVAAGTLNGNHEIDYITYAYQKGFKFIHGTIKKIDRADKSITLDSIEYKLHYDILILAVGSSVNDFNIPGVKEHCLFLDSLSEAESCNKRLLKQILHPLQQNSEAITISIVGGGATGVELAAEFNYVLTNTRKYAMTANLPTYHFKISIIEAGNRILGMLPERVSKSVSHYLQENNITILTNTKITSIENNRLITADGKQIPASMIIWAAGVQGNTTAIQHDLAVNKLHQFEVKPTLQSTTDDSIFAFGDCAQCVLTNKKGESYAVPPRAQAAHQQASLLVKSISHYLNNQPLPTYQYKDYGSLISLSRNNVIGNLMSKIAKTLYIEGFFAMFAYWMLYKKHLSVLKGTKYVILSTIADFLMRKQRPEIKLH